MHKTIKYLIFSVILMFFIKNAVCQQVTLVEDHNKSTETRISSFYMGGYSNSGNFYFTTTNEVYDNVSFLYRTDGTKSGTKLISFPNDVRYLYGLQVVPIDSYVFILSTAGIFVYNENTDSMVTFNSLSNNQFKETYTLNEKGYKVINNEIYFFTSYYNNGNKTNLWKSNGTRLGTTNIGMLNVNFNNNNFRGFQKIQNDIYVKSDSLYIINYITKSSIKFNITIIDSIYQKNNLAYFIGNNFSEGSEFYLSNGTISGTQIVKNINPGNPNSVIGKLFYVDTTFYFTGNDSQHGYELWYSNGTTNGTKMYKDVISGVSYSSVTSIIKSNNKTFYIQGSKLYYLTNNDSSSFVTVLKPSDNLAFNTVNFITSSDDTLFFRADGNFYKFFGSNSILQIVHQNVPTPNTITKLYNKAFFIDDFRKLYVGNSLSNINKSLSFTDGIYTFDLTVNTLAIVDSNLYIFSHQYNAINFLVYNINTSSPILLNKFTLGTNISTNTYGYIHSTRHKPINSKLFFHIEPSKYDSTQFWVTDGTPIGTMNYFKPYKSYTKSLEFPIDFYKFKNKAYYTIKNNGLKYLFVSQGNKKNTTVLVDSINYFYGYATLMNRLFFVVDNELYSTDGTNANLTKHFSLNAYLTNGIVYGMIVKDSLLYMLINNNAGTSILLVTNGTLSNTTILRTFTVNNDNKVSDFIIYNKEVYFKIVSNVNSNISLWKSNGTISGTVMLKSFSYLSVPSISPCVFNNKLLFISKELFDNAPYLTQTNGTTNGTVKFGNGINANGELISINNKLLITYYTYPTSRISILDSATNSISSYYGNSVYTDFVKLNNKLFFKATMYNSTKSMLWTSDGTVLGTKEFKSFSNDVGLYSNLVKTDSFLYYCAFHPKLGYEIWQTDSKNDTKILYDINEGPHNSLSNNFFAINDTSIFFTAVHPIYARELFHINPRKIGLNIIKNGNCAGAPIEFNYETLNKKTEIISQKWIIENYLTSNLKSPSFIFKSDTTYSIKLLVKNKLGYYDSLTVNHLVKNRIVKNLYLNDNKQCLTNSFHLIDSSFSDSNTFITSRIWYLGDSTILMNDSDIYYKYKSPGSYTIKLKLTNNLGCVDSIIKTVLVDSVDFVPIFNINDSVQCFNNNLFVFKDSTIFHSNIQSYNRTWDFGDNSIKTNDSIASHTFVNPGIYKVTLVIQNVNGCVDSATKYIRVDSLKSLNIIGSDTSNMLTKSTFISSLRNGIKYEWRLKNNLGSIIRNGLDSVEVSWNSTTGNEVVYLKVTDSLSCYYEDSIDIQILLVQSSNFDKNIDLELFPNPVKDNLHILNPSNLKIESIEIINLLGQKTKIVIDDNDSKIIIPIRNYIDGIYLINIISENSFKLFKIVKN